VNRHLSKCCSLITRTEDNIIYHNINVANRSFENVAQFRYQQGEYNQRLVRGKIKRKLNSSSACYHSDQNLLSCHLRSQSIKNKIYKFIICLYFRICESWSVTLREHHVLKVFENKVLRRVFGPKRDEIIAGKRKFHNAKLSSVNIVITINLMKVRWKGVQHAWKVRIVLTWVCWGSRK
jgi:hypothetical protein